MSEKPEHGCCPPSQKCKAYYVCEGECGAKLTEEEWQQHPTKACGAETCSQKGQPFAKKEICTEDA